MKQLKRKFHRSKLWARVLYFGVIIAYIISFVFFAKSIISLTGIETVIRYIVLVLFALYLILYIIINLFKLVLRKYTHLIITSIISIILIVVFCFGSTVINFIYGKIGSLSSKNNVNYKTYLVTLTDEQFNDDSVIGKINDESDYEGYTLADKLLKKENLNNKIEEYDNYLDMLYDLYDKKINAILISGSYVIRYSSEKDFSNIGNETKKVYEISEKKKISNDEKLITNKSLNEPFTALILGVDSEGDGLDDDAAFNGDTLILATFNPQTYSATLFSIPRDTYVPIVCRNNQYNKINSSAAYGTKCVTDTIEKLTGIDIDYYVKINFKGVVDLVEALEGITVNVETPDFNYNQGVDCKGKVCEQNSDRLWGPHTIYIDTGIQNLNGEQALAYSRCRHLYAISDLARNKHQQDVIMAMAKKMLTIRSYNQFEKVLNAVSDNISTNMSTDQILSSYKILKKMVGNMMKEEEFINIQKTYLEVYNLNVYISSGRVSSALGYYDSSLQDIIKVMNINLGKENPTIEKTFSYSINDTYEPYIAGKGLRSGATNSTLPNFIGKSKDDARSYCNQNDINCKFTYIDGHSEFYNEEVGIDLIAHQDVNAGTLLRNINSINFYINGATSLDD